MKPVISKKGDLKASIIVVVYNQSKTLSLILKSLLSQAFKGRYEVIISDDGSNASLFSQFRNSFNKADIPIKYVWQQKRDYRAAAARNNGIRIAGRELLLFLDGDMVPELDFIAKHVATHNKPKLLVAGNRLWRSFRGLAHNYNKLPISILLNKLKFQVVNSMVKKSEYRESQRRLEWLSSENPWRGCFSCNLSVRRSEEVYFDENFIGWGPDDQEFAYRLCKINGYTPVYKDDIIGCIQVSNAIFRPVTSW